MNMKWLQPHTETVYAVLRMVTGFLFAFHGVQKIFGVLSPYPPPEVGTQLWIGGLIELICGLLVAIGFQTRLAAFLASGTMAVAYFQFHWKFQMDQNFFPGLNQGEPAVLYCFLFLFIACRGAGKWGVDRA